MNDYSGTFSLDQISSSKDTNSISFAENSEDLKKIGELRYSLYVERDKKAYPYADHANRCFLEPVDRQSLNLFGALDERCLTTVRLTKAHLALEDEYLCRLLANTPIDPSKYDQLVIASRLVSADHPEARQLMAPILRESYRVSFLNGINFCVQATRGALVPFFARMGFVECGRSYSEEIAGELNVLILDFRDRKTLSAANSLFLKMLDSFTAGGLEKTA